QTGDNNNGTSGPTGPGAPGSPNGSTGGGSDPQLMIMPIQPTTPVADGDACNAVVQQAEKQAGRADIIFVLDNSGSMAQEVTAVQSTLNAFPQQIEAAGIDVHVVVTSAPPGGGMGGGACVDPTGIACIFVPSLTVGGLFNGNGVCIDPPLGTQG